MNIIEIASKKNLNKTLKRSEIEFVINDYNSGKIGDKEFLPFLQAIYNGKMTDKETYYLTKAMQNSGKTCDMSCFCGKSVDKHSTGGLSDTTTIILAPILACLGMYMLKASGRSLGYTGGTANKLECFSGYKLEQTFKDAKTLALKNGACLVSQSSDLAPADKKIYALRDKTGLVDNVSLIASSVMSKKLASNNDYIYLDVKLGEGAFMSDLSSAIKLAKLMKKIAQLDGKVSKIVVSDMNQPLGNNLGSYLEVIEALDILKGEKKNRLYDLTVYLASLIYSDVADLSFDASKRNVEKVIQTKLAYEKLKTMVKSSGGDVTLFDKTDYTVSREVVCGQDGYLKSFDCKTLGNLALELEHKCIKSGIVCKYSIGDKVGNNDTLFEIVNYDNIDANLVQKLRDCVIISKEKTKGKKLVYKVI